MRSKILDIFLRRKKMSDKLSRDESNYQLLTDLKQKLGAIIFDAGVGNINSAKEVSEKLKPLLKIIDSIRSTL